MNPGIYGVFNLSNGRAYIGATGRDVESRLRQHLTELRRNKHRTPELQSDWNEYGEGSFEFKVIEALSDPHGLPEREQYWMDYYGASAQLYNLTRNEFRKSDIHESFIIPREPVILPEPKKVLTLTNAAKRLGESKDKIVQLLFSGVLRGRRRTLEPNAPIEIYVDSVERYDRKRQIPPLE